MISWHFTIYYTEHGHFLITLYFSMHKMNSRTLYEINEMKNIQINYYTNAGVCWNLAVKVWEMGLVPTTATTTVLLCLFNPMPMAAVVVAISASHLNVSGNCFTNLALISAHFESDTKSDLVPFSTAIDLIWSKNERKQGWMVESTSELWDYIEIIMVH